jgi:spermidine/putrescine-binding protein
MIRIGAVILAAVLATAPAAARAADLVIWWEEGQSAEENEAVREIVAAFEQNTGKPVELVLGVQEELAVDLRSRPDGTPRTSSSRWLIPNRTNNGRMRVGWSNSRTP